LPRGVIATTNGIRSIVPGEVAEHADEQPEVVFGHRPVGRGRPVVQVVALLAPATVVGFGWLVAVLVGW
jgi:hypothetical protein